MQTRQQPAAAAVKPVLEKVTNPGVSSLPSVQAAPDEPARRSAYGLPCANCGMYYESSLPVCPVCKSPERVGPRSVIRPSGVQTSPTQSLPPVVPSALEGLPDAAALDAERDRFLLELREQLESRPVKIDPAAAAPCVREAAHADNPAAAEVCRDCYEQALESADRMEAALHMDVKEAGKIVYEAVWADTSDPDKTYVNAAEALLTTLRTRAGISTPTSNKFSH